MKGPERRVAGVCQQDAGIRCGPVRGMCEVQGDCQEQMESFVCETRSCLGEIDLISVAAADFNRMMGKLAFYGYFLFF